MKLTKRDKKQIEAKGILLKNFEEQFNIFKSGLPYINLSEVATIGNGILSFSKQEKQELIKLYDANRNKKSIIKFVPASGAATRMFKFLFEFKDFYNPDLESINSYVNRNKASQLSIFLVGIKQLPIYYMVNQYLYKNIDNYDELPENKRLHLFVKAMLDVDKLNLSNLPKGLLPFHAYRTHNSSAFQEHLFESAHYLTSNGVGKIHFTISDRHKNKFDEEFKRIETIVEEKTNTKFDVEFSYQKQSTETIAVTPKNKLFRNKDKSLMFRPSGHGALLSNLNDIDADIIFIKNIDNVVVNKYEEQVADYKKVLAGYLLKIQEETFKYLINLEEDNIGEKKIIEIAEFLTRKLNVRISIEFEKYSKKYQIEYLAKKLNRPIRVCGMVKNEGEPGGGPFWVKGENGQISLQIVESAQINKDNKQQKKILKKATHFNPVDLVCGVRDYKGQKFDLNDYIDYNTSFITSKNKLGKALKALERPGLWNGAMAHWNTIFVEVPLITFNPVKTINDLLKSTHQVK